MNSNINNRPTCYLMIGLPASGKSYLRHKMGGIHLSTDDYIHSYARDQSRGYGDVFKEAFPAAETKMKEDLAYAIENSYNIVWDQTNLNRKSRAKKLQSIPEHYYKIAVYVPAPPEDIWQDRLNDREDYQPIPMHIIRSMQKSLEFPKKDEGFDEIHVVENGIQKEWH